MLDEMFHIPHPPLAPAMTFLAIAGAGKLMTDPSIPPKGAVARVSYKEFNVVRPENPPLRDLVREFDEQGRLVTEIEFRANTQTKTTKTYRGALMLAQETVTTQDGKPLGAAQSLTWTYNGEGRLTEFRGTSGGQVYESL